jgi:hypothetical protein
MDHQPLVSAELKYWARAQPATRGWKRYLNLLLGWWTLLVSLLLFISEFVRALLGSDLNIVPYQLRWLMGIYALLAFVFYSTPWNRAQRLALRMIGRDKSKAHNWELIVLTGVDARTYVMAKWWVLVRTTFPTLLYAGLVRAGAVTFLVAEFTRSMSATVIRYSSSYSVFPPSAGDILMLGLLSVLLTFVGMPSMMALQLDNMLNAPRNGGLWWAALLRGVLFFCGGIVLFITLSMLIASLSRVTGNPLVSLMIGAAVLTSFDNGFIITGQLAVFAYTYNLSVPTYFAELDAINTLLIVLLSLPLTVFSLWFWLGMAEWTAQRYHLVARKKR